MNSTPTLTVIIPVFNEIGTLRDILKQVMDSPIDKEILIVDDASTDGSRELLRELERNQPKSGNRWRFFYQENNQGKGAAIRRAIPEATGEITIIQDADLEVSPREYAPIIQPIQNGQADVVYGNRFHGGLKGGKAFLHYAGNAVLTQISNLFSGLRIHDMETCHKAFKTSLLKTIPLRSDRFGFEPEVTAKVGRRRFRLVEVPIAYNARSYTEGKKIGLWDAAKAVGVILKYAVIDDSRHPSAKS